MYDQNLCEYPTQEYVGLFAGFLAQRAALVAETAQERPRLLEVAAGRGVLSHSLGQQLAEMKTDIEIHTSDGNSRGGSHYHGHLPLVEEENYRDSLDRVCPHIVLGAWLPDDFTRDFRRAGVLEYVLIGRPEGRGFHAGPTAWGRDHRGEPAQIPEYTRDGYQRTRLTYLRPYQLSYQSMQGAMHTSETHVFTNRFGLHRDGLSMAKVFYSR